ncbi:MAG TPA: hypothetical protein VFQ53_34925 [Kofleriaceae bacterium]|nr:hypothetical protein [Kofleriaceae bacterium]
MRLRWMLMISIATACASGRPIPDAVRATATRELGPAVEYERRADGSYEAEAIVNGRERELVIATDGRVLRVSDDEDDDEEERD